MNNRILVVGGTFNENGGKPSSLINALFRNISGSKMLLVNGGKPSDLEDLFEDITSFNLILWFPNVSNDLEKLAPRIKAANPTCILVTSKRNEWVTPKEKKYTSADVINHALKLHANLVIEFCNDLGEDKHPVYAMKLLDPLGNVWSNTYNIKEVAKVITDRVSQLTSLRRVRSECASPNVEMKPHHLRQYLEVVGRKATEFKKLIPQPANPGRFLGNAAFRCTRGFPAVKDELGVFVSARNVDKEDISLENFTRVEFTGGKLMYWGKKPSVDAPIDLLLFTYYPSARYILHGHVYADDTSMTRRVIPCGCLDEVSDIIELYPDPNSVPFVVNLRGHGMIIVSDSQAYVDLVTYHARPVGEEYHNL